MPSVLKAAAISSSIMACGDLLRQITTRAGSPGLPSSFDWAQTRRFAALGCLHGPFFFYGFRWLDGLAAAHPAWAGRGPLVSAVLKVALGQVTLFPTYTVAVFGALGLMEGLSLLQCWEKLVVAVPSTLFGGTVFWPAVNVVTFMHVPPRYRIAWINGAGLLWNGYLSWQNVTKGAAAAAVEHAEERQVAAAARRR